MSRRQSVDRPGILSPPGPFLTPSPSPSIPASPRLQPSPSQSPFSHDVLIVTNNTITNTTQEQERKAATPSRRPSIHQINSGSPNAGTVVFQPSPSQSPAAAQTVVGITGNEFNTTLVGSNNISLNKKSGKRTPQSYVNYGHGAAIATAGPLATTNMVNSPKGSSKKATAMLQSPMANPLSSPIINESPIASPSSIIKPPTPQPTMLQSLPVMNAGNHLLQFIQGPQLIAAQTSVTNQQRSQQISSSPAPTSSGQVTSTTGKNSRGHQQILPKPQHNSSMQTSDKLTNQTKAMSVQQQQQQPNQITQQSSQPQTVVTSTANQQPGGQILLPTGNLNTQPLLLNQMPVIVQQNTPQGVQLILRPPTPQLAAPSLVIHNSRPQLQQPQPQQLLRILNTNGTMQLAAAPTFIVSSQANLIQQNLQTIKANTQTTPITQLSGLQTTPRSNIAAAFNSHIIGQSVAQLQNLQLNGNLAQIQMPNGLNGPIISQLPAQFQHLPAGFNQLNLNQISSTNLQQQIAAAAAAAGAAAFQSPPPPQVSEMQIPSVVSAQNIQFSANGTPIAAQSVNLTSQAVTPQPQLIQSVTPEPVRNPTPTLQNMISHQGATTTVLVQPDGAMHSQSAATTTIIAGKMANVKNNCNENTNPNETPSIAIGATTKPPKKPKARKKKAQATVSTTTQATITTSTAACTIAPVIAPATHSKGNKKDNQKHQGQQQQQNSRHDTHQHQVTSTGKLDLANVMKLCGIMEDDDYMDAENEPMILQQQHEEPAKQTVQQQQISTEQQQNVSVVPSTVSNNSDIMITIPSQNSDIPFTFTIPTSHCDTIGQIKPFVTMTGNSSDISSIGSNNTELKSNTNIDSQNIVIKIDQADVPPYTITIPREEIQQSIQLAHQQQQQLQQSHLNSSTIQAHPVQPQQTSRSVTVSSSNCATTTLTSSASATNVAVNCTPTFVNSHITLQSQINEIQNQLIGVTSVAGAAGINSSTQPTMQVTPTSVTQQPPVTTQASAAATTTTTATTATVKPRRKPAAKRNGKKIDTIPTSVGNVPSQIGNIQISQIDATKVNANHAMPISNVVENKIQIMPIIDTAKAAQNQVNQQQGIQFQQAHHQIQPHPQAQLLHPQQQLTSPPSIHTNPSEVGKVTMMGADSRNLQIAAQPSSSTTGNVSLPIMSHQNSQTATVFPQLTGSLSLTFEEDGGRFILRHDPNLPQDPQSQIILQAILSGALCNVTIVNEPFDKNKAFKNNVTLNSGNVPVSSAGNMHNQLQPQVQQQQHQQHIAPKTTNLPQTQNKNPIFNHQAVLQQPGMLPSQPAIVTNTSQTFMSNDAQKRLPEIRKTEPPMAMVNATQSIVVNPTSPKLVALPKVDANQQLFTLNTITNQITHISPAQTTAALGPMERLLIVPVGINAQQLAECLSQGQIHFNNIGQATQASESQVQTQQHAQHNQLQSQNLPISSQAPAQIQQQIVRPQQHQSVQPLHQTPPAKQVANVAPIIDTSKAKAEAKPKKAPKPRKPKACNENISKAVKPIRKLDLTTKPSANPIQIVQPNTATKDLLQNQQQGAQVLLRATPASNISTQALNNIHPFQTTQSGNKLVGVTAPMQQISQQQRNTLNSNQCNTSSSNNNLSTNTNNIMVVSNVATNQAATASVASISNQLTATGIPPTNIHLPTVTVTPKSQPDTTQQMPPLVSVSTNSGVVPRVQTIQLTPQQQQLLKTVQGQIQQLSSRLQDKNLLANLNIPSDFNPNNPIYNKPLPQLNNIHGMNDTEIHAALQRLFIEQQKILASGKLIPTIPGTSPHAFIAATSPSPVPQSIQPPSPSPTQASNQQSLPFQNKIISTTANNLQTAVLMPTAHAKNEGQSIPANIVQPNNHNSTASNNSNTGNQQRIHIYPMQHQVQLQQQQQQQTYLQQQPHQIQTIATANHIDAQAQQVQMQIHHLHAQQQQQQQLTSPSQTLPITPQPACNVPRQLLQSTPNKAQPMPQFIQIPSPLQQQQLHAQQLQSQQQLQQQPMLQLQQQSAIQQQQQITQLIHPRPNQYQQATPHSQQSILAAPTSIETMANQGAIPPMEPTPPPSISNCSPPSGLPVTVTIKTEPTNELKLPESPAPPASPKPKIPRHCLFERQLKVDQEGCINPDYMTPFQSKEDAVKRLIRYHCMFQDDESIPSDEDDELEKIALNFRDKFKVIASKYQYLLVQESMRLHHTSELCLVNELLVNDAQNELKEMRDDYLNATTTNSNIYQQNSLYNSNMMTSSNPISSNSNKTIKKEPENGVQMGKIGSEEYLQQSRQPDYQDQQRIYHTNYPSSHPFTNNPAQQEQQQQYRMQHNQQQPSNNYPNKISSGNINHISVKTEIKSEPREIMFDKCDNPNAVSESGKVLNNRALTSSTASIVTSASNEVVVTNSGSISLNSAHAFNSSSCNKTFNSFAVKDEKDRNIFSNNSLDISSTTSFSSAKNSNFVKRETDSFDIESEITPSFIMKKIEPNNSSAALPPNTGVDHDNMTNNGFSIDYFMSSNAQAAYGAATSSSLHLNEQLSVKKKDEDDAAKDEQYDEWLCIQKELNLITEKKAESNIDNHDQKLSEIFDGPSNKTVENHLSDLFNSSSSGDSTIDASNNNSRKDHLSVANNLHLSEFFNPDSIASKSVENRLEAMFGGSPVGEKTEQDSVESRLEEIFNGPASSNSVSQHYAMISTPTQNRRQWTGSNDLMTPNTSVVASSTNTYNKRSCLVNSYLEDSHVTSNHPRWMMDQNQFDFITETTSATQNDSSAVRNKRSWNGDMTGAMEHLNSNKKLCFNNKVDTDLEHELLGLSATESNDAIANELMRQNLSQHAAMQDNSAHLHQNMNHLHNNVMMQMQSSGAVHHIQQQMQDHQQHHSHHHHAQMQGNATLMNQSSSLFDSTLNNSSANPNLSGSSSSTSISSNFDEDINRHVQNAIDSILNLQSSENDSLNFSLEHSMGSFLTDSPLDQPSHHNTAVGGSIIQSSPNNSHCVLSSIGKRRHSNRMDDLGDCLISGAGIGGVADNNSMMVGSPPSSVMATAANNSGNVMTSTAMADFSCVTGIEEAVKSIMTS